MTASHNRYDVLILGAGAAGLMCAIRAGQRGRRVVLLDHAPQAGEKILISGGGRCNFTNLGTVPERFLSDNPHFSRSALSRYKPADFVELVRKHGIAFHEKTLGQLFCDGSARQIVAMLLAECAAAGVDIRLSHRVTDVSRADHFRIETDRGGFVSENLVLATGGLSIPKMGATGLSHDLAHHFGLRLTDIRPGLVPLTFDGDLLTMMRDLSGVSLDIAASIGKRAFREAALFTHRGLSGPALLQISSYWQNGPIAIDLLPGRYAAAYLLERKRSRPKAELRTVLSEIMPARLAATLEAEAVASARPGSGNKTLGWSAPEIAAKDSTRSAVGALPATSALPLDPANAGGEVPNMLTAAETREPARIADLPDRMLTALAARMTCWQVTPNGTEGFAKAEVTCGGVDTRDLSSRTMMANAVPGLFFVGEAVDVTGWLGGYNFQWAWASGWCAGEAI